MQKSLLRDMDDVPAKNFIVDAFFLHICTTRVVRI